MDFKDAVNSVISDNNMVFMSEFGKLLGVNEYNEVVVNVDDEEIKVVNNDNFTGENWSELLTKKISFNELLGLHNMYNDTEFQVRHHGQEEDDFEACTVKYYLNDLMKDLIENYSNSEVASILQNIEIFIK